MNKKLMTTLVAVIVICALVGAAIFYYVTNTPSTLQPTGELDLSITGSSNCLRFLNDSVPMVYVPFTVASNQQMELTINATKMPGGANGWVDIYVYKGYWDGGANNTCKSGDVYSILSDIQPTNRVVMLNSPYKASFGESTQQSYTVFFVFPPGGQAQFHITLKPT